MMSKSDNFSFIIPKPDDMHVHLRDNELTNIAAIETAKFFKRAVVMPNLDKPITKAYEALDYRKRILDITQGLDFDPLMTLYFTDHTTKEDVVEAVKSESIVGIKLYPQNATTNSVFGVTSIDKIMSIIAYMEEMQLPLLIHGEVVDKSIDYLDKEKVFIDKILSKLVNNFPKLRIVLEHISTKYAVDFILSTPDNVAATITCHHLYYTLHDILEGGVKPHMYCLPIMKNLADREALQKAATSGNIKFFAGTDSAPHLKHQKENACGCAGIFSAPVALSVYAEVFDQVMGGLHNKLAQDNLRIFMCEAGAKFYNLPLNTTSNIQISKQANDVPKSYHVGQYELISLMAGNKVKWFCQTI